VFSYTLLVFFCLFVGRVVSDGYDMLLMSIGCALSIFAPFMCALASTKVSLKLSTGCGRVVGRVHNGTLPYVFLGQCSVNIPLMEDGLVVERYNYQILALVGRLYMFAFQLAKRRGKSNVLFDYKCSSNGMITFSDLDVRSSMSVHVTECAEFDLKEGNAESLGVQPLQPERSSYKYVRYFAEPGVTDDHFLLGLGFTNSPTDPAVVKVQFYQYQNPMTRIYCPLCALERSRLTDQAYGGNCIMGMLWDDVDRGWYLTYGNLRKQAFSGQFSIYDIQRSDLPCSLVQRVLSYYGIVR